MKKALKLIPLIVIVCIICAHAVAITPGTTIDTFFSTNQQASDYTDLDEVPWAVASINQLSNWGIISGYKDNLFKPLENMTRAECVKTIVCAFGMYDENTAHDFLDNAPDQWYYKYVSAAVDKGIAKGESDEWFAASSNITRDDESVLVKRAIDFSGLQLKDEKTEYSFPDQNEIADYATDSVDYLASHGLLRGNDTGNFKPQDTITRAELAVLVSRALSGAVNEI
ncbi:MAG: S-layer homology domain-containing protein [Clostridiales bacterium]|jgi:hypothetical protein|nr:S-layer homology domain-containing protein [Clostridiales bacterium]